MKIQIIILVLALAVALSEEHQVIKIFAIILVASLAFTLGWKLEERFGK